MNCLITKQGKIIECTGINHSIKCELVFQTSLSEFLTKGGIRICCKPDYETIAIEHKRKLTDRQQRLIKQMLRESDYFYVVRNNTIKRSFARPIRQIPF